MVNRDRIIKKFIEMASISSLSLKERAMADYLLSELKSIGLEEVYEDGCASEIGGNAGNIVGILRGKGSPVMFSAHMDTVGPCEDVKPIVEQEIIRSSGNSVLGADDKAGIAAILEMLYYLKESKIEHPDIVVVFSVAEEIRLLGAKSIDLTKLGIKYGFVLDSSGKPGSVVKQAPYHNAINALFKGKSAHAGIEPEKGINAFYVASKAISKLKVGRIDEETTFNPGIAKGGTATNIVMDRFEVYCEARSYSEEKLEKLCSEISAVFKESALEQGAEVEIAIEREYDGFCFDENTDLIKIAKDAAQKCTLQYSAHRLGGGSDANIYNSKNVKTLNLGIGMTKIHSKEEYITIEDLVDNARLITAIVKEINEKWL